MERNVTFIHAADLHLDSPFKGLSKTSSPHLFQEIKNSTFTALDNLVEAAVLHNVDFVLITGDLFEHENQSLKAQIRLRNAFEKLKDYKINVYLSFGNHDYISGNIHKVTYPNNVYIFPDEKVRSFVFKKNGYPIAKIYGFSYVQRAVSENKAKEFIIEDLHIPYHIAMLHGSVQGNAEHEPYAPFQVSELAVKDFHYWALGHIHKRQILKTEPYIVYPGNIQGRHRKESGEKGCYLVNLGKSETELNFLPLHAIEFNSLLIDVDSHDGIFQLEKLIQDRVDELSSTVPQLIYLTLRTSGYELSQWEKEGKIDELVELLNENLSSERPWKYIYRTKVFVQEQLKSLETGYSEHFLNELENTFNENKRKEYLNELFQHRRAKKYLNLPSDQELEEWKKTARARLFDELLRGGRR